MLIEIVTHPLFGFVWALIGFMLGHKFAISRDKRKEWNDLVLPIQKQLRAELSNPRSPAHIEFKDWFLVYPHLWFWHRKALRRKIKKQEEASDQSLIEHDPVKGIVRYDPDKVAENHHHTKEILEIIKLR